MLRHARIDLRKRAPLRKHLLHHRRVDDHVALDSAVSIASARRGDDERLHRVAFALCNFLRDAERTQVVEQGREKALWQRVDGCRFQHQPEPVMLADREDQPGFAHVQQVQRPVAEQCLGWRPLRLMVKRNRLHAQGVEQFLSATQDSHRFLFVVEQGAGSGEQPCMPMHACAAQAVRSEILIPPGMRCHARNLSFFCIKPNEATEKEY